MDAFVTRKCTKREHEEDTQRSSKAFKGSIEPKTSSKFARWLEIEENGARSLLVYDALDPTLPLDAPNLKIAAFDLDNTLITTKSGKRYPQSAKDWKLFHISHVLSVLSGLKSQSYILVIISNQLGISMGKASEEEIKTKIEVIIRHINLPILSILAIKNDRMRKPRPGAWEFILSHLKISAENVDYSKSFYCGDAAGRPKTLKRPKDHASSDYKFALNCGVAFKTPEHLFLSSKESIHTCHELWELGFDPRILAESSECKVLIKAEQELVLLCGPPASGKSFLARKYFCDYVLVNQDQLKSMQNCKKACIESLECGKSVVIDATNRDASKRKVWTEIAQKYNIPIRCILINVDKPLAMHLNRYRSLNLSGKETSSVPDVAIHTFFKQYEPPNRMCTLELRRLRRYSPARVSDR